MYFITFITFIIVCIVKSCQFWCPQPPKRGRGHRMCLLIFSLYFGGGHKKLTTFISPYFTFFIDTILLCYDNATNGGVLRIWLPSQVRSILLVLSAAYLSCIAIVPDCEKGTKEYSSSINNCLCLISEARQWKQCF